MPVAPRDLGTINAVELEQYFASAKRKWEVCGYYRRPDFFVRQDGVEEEASRPGWIEVFDTQLPKRIAMMQQGWTPLIQFGEIRVDDAHEKWTPILTHPKGPAAFPVDQVLRYGWHHPEKLPGSLRGRTDIVFPQLAGGTIKEYKCPQCKRRTFLEPHELGYHLLISHDWSRQDILTLGDRLGVDFLRTVLALVEPTEITVEQATGETSPAAVIAAAPQIEEVEIPMPKRSGGRTTPAPAEDEG